MCADKIVDRAVPKREPKGWSRQKTREETRVVVKKGVIARVTTSSAVDAFEPMIAGGADLLADLSEAERQALLAGAEAGPSLNSGGGGGATADEASGGRGGGGGGSGLLLGGPAGCSSVSSGHHRSSAPHEPPARAPKPSWMSRRAGERKRPASAPRRRGEAGEEAEECARPHRRPKKGATLAADPNRLSFAGGEEE